MARPERVEFGLSLASSSSELMNARMTSLESSPPESVASLSYSSLSPSSVSQLSALALLPARNEYKYHTICTPEDRFDRFSRNSQATNLIEVTKNGGKFELFS